MSNHANVSVFVPHIGCPHKCSFCNQNTITGSTHIPHAGDVISACETAIKSGAILSDTEIAFFGGSFTAVPKAYSTELLEAAKPYVDMGFKGIRLSTRPDCITEEILRTLKSYGVTSIELGAQSMDDDVLLANERGHTAYDVVKASGMIKSFGFALGLQMMVGLYKSTKEKDIETAKRLIDLCPDEVRIYPTVVLQNTRLGELYVSNEYKTYDIEEAVELCAELLDMFEEKGIRVIKLGLHSSQDVEGSMLGGIYHPAFRELCESERYRRRMLSMMTDRSEYTFSVKPSCASKVIGQRRKNIEYFRSKGIDIRIVQDATQSEDIKLV